MRLLLDTHLVLWSQDDATNRISSALRDLIDDPDNTPVYSVVTLWETAIKTARGRPDFEIDTRELRAVLLDLGWEELPVTGAHVVAAADLPPVHKDPFDRLLIAQAASEGIALLTVDAKLARYGDPVRLV